MPFFHYYWGIFNICSLVLLLPTKEGRSPADVSCQPRSQGFSRWTTLVSCGKSVCTCEPHLDSFKVIFDGWKISSCKLNRTLLAELIPNRLLVKRISLLLKCNYDQIFNRPCFFMFVTENFTKDLYCHLPFANITSSI